MVLSLDAEERDFAIRRPMSFFLILAFVIGFPVYLFLTRGWGGFRALFLAMLFIAALIGFQAAGVVFGDWLRGLTV